MNEPKIKENGEIPNKYNIKTLYQKISSFSNNFVGKAIITGTFIFIAYLFYQLGYSFLYGYYFGGNGASATPLAMMINQIPFDFKYIAIIGIFIFAILIIVFWLSFQVANEQNTFGQKTFYIILSMTLFIIICYILSLLNGNATMESVNPILYNMSFQLFWIMFFMANNISIILSYPTDSIPAFMIITFLNLILLMLWGAFCFTFTCSNIIVWIAILLAMYYSDILFLKILNNFAKIIKRLVKSLMLFISNHKKESIIFYLVLFICFSTLYIVFRGDLLLIISFILFIFLSKDLSRILINKRRMKSAKSSSLIVNNIKLTKRKNFTLPPKNSIKIVIFSLLIILLTACYLGLSIITYNIGQYIGTINPNQCSTINILSQDNYSLKGVVIKQEGTTYYISNENRKLVIITANQVTILPANSLSKSVH